MTRVGRGSARSSLQDRTGRAAPLLGLITLAALLTACQAPSPASSSQTTSSQGLEQAALRTPSGAQGPDGGSRCLDWRDWRGIDRISWGASVSTATRLCEIGWARYLQRQLHPELPAAPLPARPQSRIDAMQISQQPLVEIVSQLEQQRRLGDPASQLAYQQTLQKLAREANERLILRALYSPDQLQEQMVSFWLNHFSVHQGKGNLRAMLGDYEMRAIRPHALGRFRTMLGAVTRHPAMLRYLDNEHNAAGRINENYARELIELHTLGVDGGYTQRDVQELARVLTGVGINASGQAPKIRSELQADYIRDGLFEFNPNRHDYGAKTLLGRPVKAGGLTQVDDVLDRLATHPATARHLCTRLAKFLLQDEPSAPLIEAMTRSYLDSDTDIAKTLETLFAHPDFAKSLGQKFKDPQHWVFSALRLAYDEQPILNVAPVLGWLNRLGQLPFNRATPDGYPLEESAWASPAQMTQRFEIAQAIGRNSAGLFRMEAPSGSGTAAPATTRTAPNATPPNATPPNAAAPNDTAPSPGVPTVIQEPAFPQLANLLFHLAIEPGLSEATRQALAQADSQQTWNALVLSSPEFMRR